VSTRDTIHLPSYPDQSDGTEPSKMDDWNYLSIRFQCDTADSELFSFPYFIFSDYILMQMLMVLQKQIRWLSKKFVPQGVVIIQG
jgi:hypothetical protein